MLRAVVTAFISISLILTMSACQSARVQDRETTNAFRSQNYPVAIERLRKGLTDQGENGKDSLIYLLDLGLALHTSGLYEESNIVFLKADKVAEIKDYTSLSKEAATLLVSENIKDYQAEDFEYVYISAYLAMNYAALGNYEDALVEARRINHKLYRMVNEGKRKYKQSAFGQYLTGILYEASGEFDNAYVSYKKARELFPNYYYLGRDLWRMAQSTRNRDDQERWEKEYDLPSEILKQEKEHLKKHQSEIVIFYENGISPEKLPNPQFRSLPKFYPRSNPVSQATIEIQKVDSDFKTSASTQILDDIEGVALQNLDEKYAGLIAKKIAGMVAKEAAGEIVERQTGNKGWGFLTKLILYAADQADLRSWNLLPRDLQLVRFWVDSGTYTIRCVAIGAGACGEKTVQVGAGRKSFVNFRYMP